MHPDEAASCLDLLEPEAATELFDTLPASIARPLLERIRPQALAPLLADLDAERVTELIGSLPLRAASVVVLQLAPEKRDAVLRALPRSTRRALQDLGQYGPDSVGAIMEPRMATLSVNLTAEQAIAAVRKAPRAVLHYLYVADTDGTLAGVVNMRDLLLAQDDTPIRTILNPNVASVTDTMAREEAIALLTERAACSPCQSSITKGECWAW